VSIYPTGGFVVARASQRCATAGIGPASRRSVQPFEVRLDANGTLLLTPVSGGTADASVGGELAQPPAAPVGTGTWARLPWDDD
jgi:hypothetical protein